MKQILNRLFEHQYLTRSESRELMSNIAIGRYADTQVSSLLTVFLMRSISVEELSGFRESLLELSLPVNFPDIPFIDIVGTGGDGKNTFNISTASCFVVAGAGYHVVKHGNIGATSVSGASNVMSEHGIKFTTDSSHLNASLDRCRVAYLHAPLFNPALKAVAPVRKSFAVRNFFNMLGPLVNPANPRYQLLGVFNLSLLRLYTYVYQSSGINFGVVHSLDGYDEISLTSDFKLTTLTKEKLYSPEDLGLPRCQESDLYGGDTPAAAARIFDAVLSGTSTQPQRNCVLANAAFSIRVLHPEKSLDTCFAEADESLKSGRALSTFKKFVEFNS